MGIGKAIRPEREMIHYFYVQVEIQIDCIHKKVAVLEVRKQKEVHKNTHDHPKFLPAFLFCIVNQVPQVKIGCGRKDEDQKKETGGFPVEKKADCEKKNIPEGALLINSRVEKQYHKIESPKKEPGENQRFLRTKEEYIGEDLTQWLSC